MKKLIFSLLIVASLSACSSMQNVHGIGSGTDQYKQSPCACLLITQPNIG